MNHGMKLLAVLASTAALALAACGGDDSGCLTPQEVQDRVDEIAGGFETSQEEVQKKQDEIREVRARECP